MYLQSERCKLTENKINLVGKFKVYSPSKSFICTLKHPGAMDKQKSCEK